MFQIKEETLKIAIIGTRGIPNYYGGFEQFAEYLSVGLVSKGHSVTVYNSHTHPFKEKNFKGVEIIHCNDPEKKFGTIGQFIYDFNCIVDTRKKNYDIILQLGYTSSSIWGRLLPRKKSIVTTNMDGMEWKRTKYSSSVQKFLRYAEKLGVKFSDFLISDSIGIQHYLKEKYKKDSTYIPYGAHVFNSPKIETLNEFSVTKHAFHMLIARLEPENSIEIILDGVLKTKCNKPILVIGNHMTKYGEFLKNKYKGILKIKFIGPVYDIEKLNNLRFFSSIYFHGHTVGGTNPSLLEAMSSQALICANDNVFNKSILGSDAFYFKTPIDVEQILNSEIDKNTFNNFMERNIEKINQIYDWKIIIDQYESHFIDCRSKKSAKKEL